MSEAHSDQWSRVTFFEMVLQATARSGSDGIAQQECLHLTDVTPRHEVSIKDRPLSG